MKKNSTHIAGAWLMVGLFLFALAFQGVHQLKNPAKASIGCDSPFQHLHQQTRTHNCNICDYQITDYVRPLVVMEPYPQLLEGIGMGLNDSPFLPKLHQSPHRGPPVG